MESFRLVRSGQSKLNIDLGFCSGQFGNTKPERLMMTSFRNRCHVIYFSVFILFKTYFGINLKCGGSVETICFIVVL